MSETDLTLSPIDLSTIPELGFAEQEELVRTADESLVRISRNASIGFFGGIASAVGIYFSMTGGSYSIVGVLAYMALLTVSGTGAIYSACCLLLSNAETHRLDKLLQRLAYLDQRLPLALHEQRLRTSAEAWNDALAAWQEANDATSLDDPKAHREAIFHQAEKLLDAKRHILGAIERLKPYDKLLTPIE